MLRLLLLVPFLFARAASADPAPAKAAHRVVLQLTSGEPEAWAAALENIENLRKALGEERTEVELVAHGPGIGIVLKRSEKTAARVEALAKEGVVFAACANTMKKRNLTPDDLVAGVRVVPSGVAEVVLRQEAGWAYVKAGF